LNTSGDATWYSWNTYGTYGQLHPQPIVLSIEQIAEQERVDAERRAVEIERKRVEAEADARAMELLESELSPEQRADFMKDNAFFVIGQSGRVYQITKGRAHNVFAVDENRKPVVNFCVVPKNLTVPTPDILLMQKLLLEHQEDLFLRTANSRVL
jgi:hypothetical protein